MAQAERPVPRVLVGAVMAPQSRGREDMGKIAAEEVRAAKLKLVRTVFVKGERTFIQQLVSNVSNANEADAIILVGGTGFGPSDVTSEAIDTFVERRIEGFGEAFRLLLRTEMDCSRVAWLFRATAGVYNQCLVFALTGRGSDVKRAVQTLIVPALSDAVELATGRMRTGQLRS
ncbi:MAG TPA: molybdopterin-binding protein [Solirubrobacteraceae bacterium]